MNWRDLHSKINCWPHAFLTFPVEVHWHGGQRFVAVLGEHDKNLCLQLRRYSNENDLLGYFSNWGDLRDTLFLCRHNWMTDLSRPCVVRLPEELHDQHQYHVELVRYHLEIENFHHHDYELGGEAG